MGVSRRLTPIRWKMRTGRCESTTVAPRDPDLIAKPRIGVGSLIMTDGSPGGASRGWWPRTAPGLFDSVVVLDLEGDRRFGGVGCV